MNSRIEKPKSILKKTSQFDTSLSDRGEKTSVKPVKSIRFSFEVINGSRGIEQKATKSRKKGKSSEKEKSSERLGKNQQCIHNTKLHDKIEAHSGDGDLNVILQAVEKVKDDLVECDASATSFQVKKLVPSSEKCKEETKEKNEEGSENNHGGKRKKRRRRRRRRSGRKKTPGDKI